MANVIVLHDIMLGSYRNAHKLHNYAGVIVLWNESGAEIL